ncbi:type VI secretion system tip protein VgrG [Ideonella sp. DXS22W]|uniref:Type VI secretion system tip protein VgrG n=1 Tax=Pseudaquabacterium inlustre TaxID=2984192 RepID=A0ABU9CDT6_9BURK
MSAISVEIRSEGQPIDSTLSLLSIDIRRELNRVPSAQLVFVDGDLPQRKFPVSDSDSFAVGALVSIAAGYVGGTPAHTRLFEGVVVRHTVEAGPQGSTLSVELRDKAVRLTQLRRSTLFEQMKDSDVFKKLVGAAGLKTGEVQDTVMVHPALVQHQCSDWDFLLTRAEAMGRVVLVKDGALSLRAPAAAGQAVLQAQLGLDSVYTVELELDGLAAQVGASATSLDMHKLSTGQVKGKAPPALAPGKSRSAAMAAKLFNAQPVLTAAASLENAELDAWSSAALMRAELATVRGRVSLQGTAKAELLAGVALDGVGQRFAGTLPITGLAHRIADGDWRTDLQLGLPARPHHLAEALAAPPAAGLHPPATGLSLAVVAAVHEDPDKSWRVKIQPAGLPGPPMGLWARLALPSAGKGRGWYLRPEVNDLVVVGYLGDDPRQPVVLGCLHSANAAPPQALTDDSGKNALSGFVTRSGLSLVLDDEKKTLQIKTPGGHQVLLDDQDKAIQLKDSHGNELVLDQNGVRIKSTKDLTLEASGNVAIQGSAIDLK